MLKTYVDYSEPGFLFAESEVKEIESRSIELALKMMPKNCYAFRFYSVEVVEQGGETLRGAAKNYSGWFYPGGERRHWKSIPNTPENQILISNIKYNGLQGYGILTRMGNWQWWQKGDKIIAMS